MEVVGLEHLHEVVRIGSQVARERFHAGHGVRARDRLVPLVVPVLARRDAALLGEQRDQLLLRLEPAAGEAVGHERIEDQRRPERRVTAVQGAAECLPPRLVPQAGAEDRVPAAQEQADAARARVEPVLHVEGLPGLRSSFSAKV